MRPFASFAQFAANVPILFLFRLQQPCPVEDDAHRALCRCGRSEHVYSSGSTWIIVPSRLLPIQNAGGLDTLSTFTRRMFVVRGSKYSVVSPLLVFTLTT